MSGHMERLIIESPQRLFSATRIVIALGLIVFQRQRSGTVQMSFLLLVSMSAWHVLCGRVHIDPMIDPSTGHTEGLIIENPQRTSLTPKIVITFRLIVNQCNYLEQ